MQVRRNGHVRVKPVKVHGVFIGSVFPDKESRTKVGVKYFEGKFSDGKKTVRVISFELILRDRY